MSDNRSNNRDALARMRAALEEHLAGKLAAPALVSAWREATPGLTLPPAYGQVRDELLRRMEMAAAFAQDSCSFSSTAVTDQMMLWLSKAEKL